MAYLCCLLMAEDEDEDEACFQDKCINYSDLRPSCYQSNFHKII